MSAPRYRTRAQRVDGMRETSRGRELILLRIADAMGTETNPDATKRERVLAWGALRAACDALGEIASDMSDIG